MRIQLMIKTLFDVFKNRGLKFTFIYFKELMLFDLKHNTNTFLRKKSIQFEDGIHYVSVFDSALKKIETEIKKLQLTNNFIFIDLGSGKGKPLLYLSCKFPNSNFLGIEIDKDLHEIAIKNQKSKIKHQTSNIKHQKSIL